MKGFKTAGTYLLALLLFNLAACSSLQPVSVPTDGYAADGVEIGNRVELLTREGVTHTFDVTEIDERGIGGEPGFFAYAEIQSLQVREPGEGKMVMAVLAVAALSALFWLAVDEVTKVTLSTGF